MMLHLCGEAALVEFAIESRAVADLPRAALLRLALRASAFNTRAGLTGRLALKDGRFHQTLEGETDTILPLAARILADPRHESIRTIAFRALPARRFAGWAVEGFDFGDLDGALPDNLCFLPERPARRRAGVVPSVHGIGNGTVSSA
jgi:hypothetical protein